MHSQAIASSNMSSDQSSIKIIFKNSYLANKIFYWLADWINQLYLMHSDKHNLVMTIAIGLISSLLNLALSRNLPLCLPQQLQTLHRVLTKVLLTPKYLETKCSNTVHHNRLTLTSFYQWLRRSFWRSNFPYFPQWLDWLQRYFFSCSSFFVALCNGLNTKRTNYEHAPRKNYSDLFFF